MKIGRRSQSQSGIAKIAHVLIAGVLVFGGLAGYKITTGGDDSKEKNYVSQSDSASDSNKASDNSSISGWKTKCSGSGTVHMKTAPMKMSDVDVILPLGTLAGAHVTPIDHLYLYPKDMSHVDAAPVYAMADGYIVSYENRGQGQQGGVAIRIVMQHTCTFYTYFDLLTSLSAELEAKVKSGNLHIEVKAGQEIGRVGGQSLDTAIYNFDKTLTGFVKPDSYEMEPWKIHTDDFFPYFDSPAKDEMLALNPRKVEPRSGKIDYDVAGTLAGNWFAEGTNGYAGPKGVDKTKLTTSGYFSGHLSIAPDAVDPTLINVSTGSFENAPKQFTIINSSQLPQEVSVNSGIVKYELTTYAQPGPTIGRPMLTASQFKPVLATAIFQVLPDNKLKAEIVANKKASEVPGFSSNAQIYER